MKLYSLRDGVSSVSDDDGSYKVDKDGTVDVPMEMGVRLRDTHIDGAKAWEDDAERVVRLAAEEDARRRDPASAYDALTQIAESLTSSAPRKRAAAKKAAPRKAPTPRAKKAAPAPAKKAPAKRA